MPPPPPPPPPPHPPTPTPPPPPHPPPHPTPPHPTPPPHPHPHPGSLGMMTTYSLEKSLEKFIYTKEKVSTRNIISLFHFLVPDHMSQTGDKVSQVYFSKHEMNLLIRLCFRLIAYRLLMINDWNKCNLRWLHYNILMQMTDMLRQYFRYIFFNENHCILTQIIKICLQGYNS